MKVLLTGATGFVGRGIAEALAERGADLRCLVRSPARGAELRSLGAELVVGSVDPAEGLEAAVSGVACVVHAAGCVRAWTRRQYFGTNELGTRRLAAAAREAGVRRFLYLSSLAASGPSAPGRPVTEESPPRPVNAYGRSKLAGERALEEEAGRRMEAVVIRPCAVYGPRDRDFLGLFRLVERGLGLYAAARGAELSLVFVDDLANLCCLALERARAGSVYLAAADPSVTWRGLVEAIGAALGRRPLCLRIPPSVLFPLACAAALGRPFLARPPVVSVGKVIEARQAGWVASARRTAAELDWSPRVGLAEGTRRAAEWYRERGWLRPARAGLSRD